MNYQGPVHRDKILWISSGNYRTSFETRLVGRTGINAVVEVGQGDFRFTSESSLKADIPPYLDSAAEGFNLLGELAEWNSAERFSDRAPRSKEQYHEE
jgi:hypothetical protein